MLSPSELKHYEEQGYIGPYTLFTPEEMAKVRDRVEKEVFTKVGPQWAPGDFNGSKFHKESFLRHRHLDCRLVYDLCTHPAITDRLADIYGPDLVIWFSVFKLKEPGDIELPWHTDKAYWPLTPCVSASAWIAIDPATPENANVQIIPGSHKWDVPHTKVGTFQVADPALIDPKKVRDMTMKPGEFFLYNESLLHHSHANRSQKRRLGLAARITTPDVKVDHAKFYPGHTAILVRGRDRRRLNQLSPPPE